jgi:hypothetical protein
VHQKEEFSGAIISMSFPVLYQDNFGLFITISKA